MCLWKVAHGGGHWGLSSFAFLHSRFKVGSLADPEAHQLVTWSVSFSVLLDPHPGVGGMGTCHIAWLLFFKMDQKDLNLGPLACHGN